MAGATCGGRCRAGAFGVGHVGRGYKFVLATTARVPHYFPKKRLSKR
jgi:hypothetical protein